ncbi:MAG: VanW family protein [Candidatus Magasanikbacteria bacterium]|nr:VanW family protein [Candidatus Magasanikbacteria bacterium]
MIFLRKFFCERVAPLSWRRIWFTAATAVVAAGFLGAIFFGLTVYYRDRVLPNIYFGGVAVGGLESEELQSFLQGMYDKLVSEGLRFVVATKSGEKKFVIYPVIVTDSHTIELAKLDVEVEIDRLLRHGKNGDFFDRSGAILYSLFYPTRLAAQTVVVDERRLIGEVNSVLAAYEEAPHNSGVRIFDVSPLRYEITSSTPGVIFSVRTVAREVAAAWSHLAVPEVYLGREEKIPNIREAEVAALAARLPAIFRYDGLDLSYADPYTQADHKWHVPTAVIARWLGVEKKDGQVVFVLDKEAVNAYLDNAVRGEVALAPENARFRIDQSGRVVEFQTSRPGVSLDIGRTYEAMNEAILQRLRHDEGVVTRVPLAAATVEPEITTQEVDTLGITEVLGSGVSYFSGSPVNRLKNIRNGVKKLNGLLIKPDEEFSTLLYTGPFTEEDGYVPELVIKGDELKPEIGGGLCQLGTTLFRMAMNTGLPITERRNHSLAVAYYNDLTNGLPGTDATIYDPAPDFRFKNDTGNYLLLQTTMDEKKSKLTFTLWGRRDGRSGRYTPPIVKKTIPHGETKYIETGKLSPGEKKCQKAYDGAQAYFTYIRQLPDGTKEERRFDSYYRPLPEICLVGVASSTPAVIGGAASSTMPSGVE